MSYILKSVGDSTVLGALLTKDGSPLSGLYPTLELRRNSDTLYLDFSALAPPFWVSSGGQQQLTLSEASWLPGYYFWTFDQLVYDNTKNDYTAIYRNSGLYTMTEIEIISFQESPKLDVSFIRKMFANKQTLQQVATDHMIHTVFDDDKTTPIYGADITINVPLATETRDPS